MTMRRRTSVILVLGLILTSLPKNALFVDASEQILMSECDKEDEIVDASIVDDSSDSSIISEEVLDMDVLKDAPDSSANIIDEENIMICSEENDELFAETQSDSTVEVLQAELDEDGNIASGTYGDVTWVIDSNGKLTVSGVGNAYDGRHGWVNPWYRYRSSIISAEISMKEVTNMYSFFDGCTNLISIDMSMLDTSKVEDMWGMFRGCNSLTNIDLSNFKTSNVQDMSSMFWNCESLEKLDISTFSTSNVESMSGMFYGCKIITNMDLSNFQTSNVQDMSYMFKNCESLEKLDISTFSTSNVENMREMFSGCKLITDIDLSNFQTSKVQDMSYMFGNCESIKKLDISTFRTPNVENMYGMFGGCKSLTNIDLSRFQTSNVRSMAHMFESCEVLESIDVSMFNTENVNEIYGMFHGCKKLKQIDLSSFDVSSMSGLEFRRYGYYQLFKGCSSLENIDISNFSPFTSRTDEMFADCVSLKNVKLPVFETDLLLTMRGMFSGCSSLQNLEITINVMSQSIDGAVSMESMFERCSSLRHITFSCKNIFNVSSIERMFSGCSSLNSVDLSNFKMLTTSIYESIDTEDVFRGCVNLVEVKGPNSLDNSAVIMLPGEGWKNSQIGEDVKCIGSGTSEESLYVRNNEMAATIELPNDGKKPLVVGLDAFSNPSYNYDPNISTLSICLSTMVYERSGTKPDEEKTEHKRIANQFEKLGFGYSSSEEEFISQHYFPDITGNSYKDFDRGNYSPAWIAHRHIISNGSVYTLLCVVVRGTYNMEWIDNFEAGIDINHVGFKRGADFVRENIERYIKDEASGMMVGTMPVL